MKELMNIPKLIHVGCVERKDTYTGQLAYVIYTDEKGKVRKQTSWEGWRDKSIDPQDFNNEPTEGFVLNKGVGGARHSYGWNARNEYIRVYDPRGFEFEISVANLLFILQECNAIKGKGLEGEFVYAWSGTELVLLPTTCEEYKTSTEFTAAKSMKVTRADMVEGCEYLHKDMRRLVYIGREAHREFSRYEAYHRGDLQKAPTKKSHVFWDIENEEFTFERGFTKLAKRVTDTAVDGFADIYTSFQNSKYVDIAVGIKLVPITIYDMGNKHGRHYCNDDDIKDDVPRYSETFIVETERGTMLSMSLGHPYNNRKPRPVVVNPNGLSDLISFDNYDNDHPYQSVGDNEIHRDEFRKVHMNDKFFTAMIEFESGTTMELYGYVNLTEDE